MIPTSAEHFNQVDEDGLRGLQGEAAYLSYADYILRVTSPPPESTLLDLGCGDGRVLRKIADLRPDLRLIGWDFADQKIAQAREEGCGKKNLSYEMVDLKDVIPDGALADVAYSFSVIQYFRVSSPVQTRI